MNRVPPHNVDAERGLLGCVMLDASLLDEVVDLVEADDFYDQRHNLVWKAVCAVKGVPDVVTVLGELRGGGKLGQAGGEEFIFSLTNTIPTIAAAQTYARTVRELARVRRVIAACHSAAGEGYAVTASESEAYLDKAGAEVFAAFEARADDQTCQPIGDIVSSVFTEIANAAERGETLLGKTTGLVDLDVLLSGMRNGHLIILAGRPSMGKSALAGNITRAVAETGEPVFVASLEMPRAELAQRMLASEAEIDSSRLRTAQVRKDDWPTLVQAAGTLEPLPIDIDDNPGLTLLSLRAKCRRARKRRGSLGLVVVDYLQLMRAGGKYDNREREIAEISRSLKGLAKELEVPVLALSQLNRAVEGRIDKRPSLADLRESGAIEQDADVVMMLFRLEVYNATPENRGVAEIIVAKHRGGATGTVKCRFNKKVTRFENLSQYEPEESWFDR